MVDFNIDFQLVHSYSRMIAVVSRTQTTIFLQGVMALTGAYTASDNAL